jgi:hypothetical protein
MKFAARPLQIVQLIAALLTLAAIVFLFRFCTALNSCGPNSDALFYVRALSAQRLEKLYRDMERLSSRSIPSGEYVLYDDREAVPEEFSDLKFAKVNPRFGKIMVEGCLDEYIVLRFKGTVWTDDPAQIELSYPTHSGEPYEMHNEIIWQGQARIK